MAAGIYNITIEQGATFRLRLTIRTGSTPFPLTGYTARMQIRHKVQSTDVLYALTTENGGIELGGSAGTVDLYIADEDTTLFDFRTGVYDLELEDTVSGDVTRVLQGAVVLSPEVTR